MNQDTNCNDVLRVEVLVNGKKYFIMEETVNTQKDFYQWQTRIMSTVESIKLADISRFKPV
jgi:hypothetical protein